MDADQWLRKPVFDERIANFAKRLLQRADVLYQRGEHGVAELPWDCRPAIQAARLVYAEIGRQLEREGLNSVDYRAVVSKPRKLYLIARATAVAVNAPAVSAVALTPVPAIAFLVHSVADAHGHVPRRKAWRIPQRNFEERVEWMVNLLGRLEERERPTP
jgi:phytoene synthase